MYFTHRPIEWDQFMRETMGAARYRRVRADALALTKPDMPFVLADLRERWAELEEGNVA
jgi:hypothetical protein